MIYKNDIPLLAETGGNDKVFFRMIGQYKASHWHKPDAGQVRQIILAQGLLAGIWINFHKLSYFTAKPLSDHIIKSYLTVIYILKLSYSTF